MNEPGRLRRTLGVGDAVVIGAGSMIGAGVFSAWSPAAEAAGDWLLAALGLAAAVAFANATSSAQLAAIHPESGGTYVYARHRLGPAWGHLAGWGFVVGKTASCSAMALTFGAYLTPDRPRLGAVVAVVSILMVNIGGLSRTVAVTRVLLVVSLSSLALVVITGLGRDTAADTTIIGDDFSAGGVLRGAGFLFFAFAGYARIATLGEEVRDPETTIPKAIPRALGFVLAVYAVVAMVALSVVGPDELASSTAPLRRVAGGDAGDAIDLAVRAGAGIASLGVLLNLIPGISRTVLAMARNDELPSVFSVIDPGRNLPIRAELMVSTVVLVLIVTLQLSDAIAVSGVAVLLYYALTNASALRLSNAERRWPKGLAGFGLAGCGVLILSLPVAALVEGAIVLALGVLIRRLQRGTSPV